MSKIDDLTQDIMNISQPDDIEGHVSSFLAEKNVVSLVTNWALHDQLHEIILLAYHLGHRDARHAATELVLSAIPEVIVEKVREISTNTARDEPIFYQEVFVSPEEVISEFKEETRQLRKELRCLLQCPLPLRKDVGLWPRLLEMGYAESEPESEGSRSPCLRITDRGRAFLSADPEGERPSRSLRSN
jgi:hypothetical protein